MDGWNTSFPLEWPIFRGDVSFREGNIRFFLHASFFSSVFVHVSPGNRGKGYWDPSLAFVMGCGICVTWQMVENLGGTRTLRLQLPSSVAICFRGHDKPRLMGVAIAIDPFQVVSYIIKINYGIFSGRVKPSFWDTTPVESSRVSGVQIQHSNGTCTLR